MADDRLLSEIISRECEVETGQGLEKPSKASSFIDGETKRENISFRKLGT